MWPSTSTKVIAWNRCWCRSDPWSLWSLGCNAITLYDGWLLCTLCSVLSSQLVSRLPLCKQDSELRFAIKRSCLGISWYKTNALTAQGPHREVNNQKRQSKVRIHTCNYYSDTKLHGPTHFYKWCWNVSNKSNFPFDPKIVKVVLWLGARQLSLV